MGSVRATVYVAQVFLVASLCARAQSDLLPLTGDVLHHLEAAITDQLHLPRDYDFQDEEEFEYVVVGGGAAGSAAAAGLALSGRRVLLVEAGRRPTLLSRVPAGAMALLGSPLDWQYRTRPNNVSCLGSEGGRCRFSRGKALGGSTAINYMMYVRGNRRDYDYPLPGWTWPEFEPYFLRSEALRDPHRLPPSSAPFHNTSGTVRVGFCADPENEWHDNIVDGFRDLNFPFNADVNAESQIGVSRVLTYTAGGERESTARSHLARGGVRRALRLATGAHCTAVLFDDSDTAVGVSAVLDRSGRSVAVRATRGVVLSAGAIGTPQILMLSGVGPRAHLEALGVRVRADLPVGDNMSDHVLPLVFVRTARPLLRALGAAALTAAGVLKYAESRDGPLASIGLTDITAFANTSCYDFAARRLRDLGPGCELPTLQLINAYVDRGVVDVAAGIFKRSTLLNDDIIAQLAAENARHALIVASPVVLAPHSRGRVRLASRDPLAPPDVFPDYLSDERDVEEMLRSIAILEHLVETPAYRALGASVVRLRLAGCPRHAADAAGYWRCYVRRLTFSVYHAAGTAALGAALDARLRVRGVRSLRVADLSALPAVPRGNTAAPAIALGERVVDFILEDEINDRS